MCRGCGKVVKSGWQVVRPWMGSYHCPLAGRPTDSQLNSTTRTKNVVYIQYTSWWWATDMPEICRGWLTNKLRINSASSWFLLYGTNCCIYTVYLLMMGYRYVRNINTMLTFIYIYKMHGTHSIKIKRTFTRLMLFGDMFIFAGQNSFSL